MKASFLKEFVKSKQGKGKKEIKGKKGLAQKKPIGKNDGKKAKFLAMIGKKK